MSYLKRFFRNNWFGATLGIFYFTCSMVLFFLGLGYGAGCQGYGSGYCNPTMSNLYQTSYYLILLPVLSWEFFFYLGGQILVGFSQLHRTDESLSSIQSTMILSFSLILGATGWIFVGASLEKLYKYVRGE